MGRKNEATRDKFALKSISRDPSYKRLQGNYPAKKYQKGTPVTTRLSFECTGPGTVYIDIARALSIINRRLYRQGLYYYVNSIEYYDAQPNLVDIHTVPDNWVTRMAHRRGKAMFDAMNERILVNAGTVIPKYHDFKVFVNAQHVTNGSADPALHTINQASVDYSPDDWVYSAMVSADDDGDTNQQADDFLLHLLGPHNGVADNWDSVGLIKSYADTRAEPQTSNPVVNAGNLAVDPLMNTIDYSSEEQVNDVLTNLSEDNDAVPYDANQYIGEVSTSLQQVARLSTHEGGGGRVSIGSGFCAPCGLVVVDPDNTMPADNNFRIVLNLAVGTYNGVYAERI